MTRDPAFGHPIGMEFPEFAVEERLVSDSERDAFAVFSRMISATSADERTLAAIEFSDILGNSGEFTQYVHGPARERLANIDRLLKTFEENVQLLVHKTWVEKSDEKHKEKLLEELSAFEEEYKNSAVRSAFIRFVALARSIAHLLFGAQSNAADFLVYCFRIDPKLGLFFWFLGELEDQSQKEQGAVSDDLMNVETIIGVYILSCF